MPRRNGPPPPPPRPLCKQNSWSPDLIRDEAWERRKNVAGGHRGRSKSVTDDDLEELKACMELGFGFDSPEIDPKLSDTFPALGLYQAVNKQFQRTLSRSSSVSSVLSSVSDNDLESSTSIYEPGEDPEMVKTRLKQWAQVVACSVRHSNP